MANLGLRLNVLCDRVYKLIFFYSGGGLLPGSTHVLWVHACNNIGSKLLQIYVCKVNRVKSPIMRHFFNIM